MRNMKLTEMRDDITKGFVGDFQNEKINQDQYSTFSYPKWSKIMKFSVDRYKVAGFGHYMTMHTKGPFGMELLTTAFMPGEGGSVPFLLIDIMTVGKKRTVFVEYYDCTTDDNEYKELVTVHQKYCDLPEYDEKPKWYVGERHAASLIKCGGEAEDTKLQDMVNESVKAYVKEVKSADIKEDNLSGLIKFRDRMIHEGNPSSAVLSKVFGEEGAETFFKKCVMPLKEDM